MNIYRDDEEFARFMRNVSIGDGCWEWSGHRNRNGYGVVYRGGRRIGAHRVAHEIFHGEIPSGLFVLHSCDNRSCVRPGHLRAGTPKENMVDRVEHGRVPSGYRRPNGRGSQHPGAKITESQAREIKRRLRAGERPVDVRKALRVSKNIVNMIKLGATWAWL